MTEKKGGSMMRDPEKEYENAQDVMMELKARDEDMTGRRRGLMTNLKRIIDEKGVQQRWLAEQVGVTEVSMSRYVNGERIPKAPLAIKMADALGVDVKELYGWDDAHVIGKDEDMTTEEAAKWIQIYIDEWNEDLNQMKGFGMRLDENGKKMMKAIEMGRDALKRTGNAQPEREAKT